MPGFLSLLPTAKKAEDESGLAYSEASFYPKVGALNYTRLRPCDDSVMGSGASRAFNQCSCRHSWAADISRTVSAKYCLSPMLQICFVKATILSPLSLYLEPLSSLRETRKTQHITGTLCWTSLQSCTPDTRTYCVQGKTTSSVIKPCFMLSDVSVNKACRLMLAHSTLSLIVWRGGLMCQRVWDYAWQSGHNWESRAWAARLLLWE